MRQQVGFETWMPEHGFLIGFAVHLFPCRQVVAAGEQHIDKVAEGVGQRHSSAYLNNHKRTSNYNNVFSPHWHRVPWNWGKVAE